MIDNYSIVSDLVSSCRTYEEYEKLSYPEKDAILCRVCRNGKVLDNDGFITRILYHGIVYSVHFMFGIQDIEVV